MDPVWGQLAKSAVDPEKIEEAIARIIAEHNDDPEAHLGAGQSLQSHKASEIIDHLARSIVADKVKDFEIELRKLSAYEYQFMTAFESLDGWTQAGDGSFTHRTHATLINSGSALNSYKDFTIDSARDWYMWDKDVFFHAGVRFDHNTSQEIYVGIFDFSDGNLTRGIGFKVVNAQFYAVVRWSYWDNGNFVTDEKATEITGFERWKDFILSVSFDAATPEIKFYINGELKHTETIQMPSPENAHIFSFRIKTTTTANRRMEANYLFCGRKL